MYGLSFMMPCVESGAVLDDPHGSPPAQDILWFYNLPMTFLPSFGDSKRVVGIRICGSHSNSWKYICYSGKISLSSISQCPNGL